MGPPNARHRGATRLIQKAEEEAGGAIQRCRSVWRKSLPNSAKAPNAVYIMVKAVVWVAVVRTDGALSTGRQKVKGVAPWGRGEE